MYRLTERLGYRHVSDLLQDMGSAELTGWQAYLRVDDEVRTQRSAYAIAKAFNGDKKQPTKREEEEVIDTTKPEFAEKFQGFIHQPKQQPRRRAPGANEVKIG